jgi:hypothetical protein
MKGSFASPRRKREPTRRFPTPREPCSAHLVIDLGFGFTDEQRMIRDTTLRMCKPFDARRQEFERAVRQDGHYVLDGENTFITGIDQADYVLMVTAEECPTQCASAAAPIRRPVSGFRARITKARLDSAAAAANGA